MIRKLQTVYLVVALLILIPSTLIATDIAKVFQDSYAEEAKGNLTEAYRMINDLSIDNAEKIVNYALKMRLAYLKSLMRKGDESAILYGEAAKIMPDSIEPLLNQEYQYLLLKDWRKLIETSINALKIDPNNYTSRTRLAYAYFSTGDYSSSVKEYSNVLKLYPLDLEVKNMIGWSYAYLKDKNRATQIFQEILTIAPSHKPAKNGLEYLKK